MNYWHLHKIDWFAQLPRDIQIKLELKSVVKQVGKGEMIFEPTQQPERVFVLKNGLCRIYSVSDSGEEFTLDFVAPGEIFGELAILDERPQVNFAQAFEDCQLLQFGRTFFIDMMQSVPSFSISVTKQVSGRLISIQNRAEDLVFRSATTRLARILLSLDDICGHDSDFGRCLGLRLTQSEIGTLIGASRPTTSLLINAFKAEGLIAHRGGHIVLANINELRLRAEKY